MLFHQVSPLSLSHDKPKKVGILVFPPNFFQDTDIFEKSKTLCEQMSSDDDWLKRDVLTHAGNRWSFSVLYALKIEGRLRHAQLRRHLDDVSQRMLTRTLRSLERDGLLRRFDYDEVPPRVEYELSELGDGLLHQIIPVWLRIMDNVELFRSVRQSQTR